MEPLSATVVLSLFTPSFRCSTALLPDDAVEWRERGVNKERTTVALKGFMFKCFYICLVSMMLVTVKVY